MNLSIMLGLKPYTPPSGTQRVFQVGWNDPVQPRGDYKTDSQDTVVGVLKNGRWLCMREIENMSQLSDATVRKVLAELVKQSAIEARIGFKGKKEFRMITHDL